MPIFTSFSGAFGVISSASKVVLTEPGAPTIGTATAASSTSATITFTAPTDDGGSTITSYTAVSSPGNITGSINQSGSGTITVTGLTTGTSYTFVVYATNSVGNSANSSSSNSITPVSQGLAVVVSSAANRFQSLAVSSSGDVFAGAINSTFSAYNIQSRTSDGAVGWSYNYPAQTYLWLSSVAVERSNTSTIDANAVYAFGVSDTSTTSFTTKGELVKMTTGGTLTWRQRISSGNATATKDIGGGSQYQLGVGHDGIVMYAYNPNPSIIKYNMAGTFQWVKAVTGGLTSGFPTSVCNREGSSYFCLQHWPSGAGAGTVVIKLGTTGTTTWQRFIQSPTSGTYFSFEAIDIDNNQNVLVGGRGNYLTGGSVFVSLSSAGTTTRWAYSISSFYLVSIHYSKSQSAIYLAGSTSNGVVPMVVMKFDLNGNLLWKNKISGNGITVGSNMQVYTGLNDTTYFYVTTGKNTMFKLLADGTLSNLSPWTYEEATTNTITSFTPGNVAGSATIGAGTATGAAASTNLAALEVTQTVTNF